MKNIKVGNTWFATWQRNNLYLFGWKIGREPKYWDILPENELAIDEKGCESFETKDDRDCMARDIINMQDVIQESNELNIKEAITYLTK